MKLIAVDLIAADRLWGVWATVRWLLGAYGSVAGVRMDECV